MSAISRSPSLVTSSERSLSATSDDADSERSLSPTSDDNVVRETPDIRPQGNPFAVTVLRVLNGIETIIDAVRVNLSSVSFDALQGFEEKLNSVIIRTNQIGHVVYNSSVLLVDQLILLEKIRVVQLSAIHMISSIRARMEEWNRGDLLFPPGSGESPYISPRS